MVRGQWGNLARMLELHPYSFSRDILVIFNDHRELGPRFNISSGRTDTMLSTTDV